MAEFRRVKSELFEGDAPKLRKVIEAHRAIGQTPVEREFDEAWASGIKARVLKGWAVSFQWAIADMTVGKATTRLRINGNHSSWALAQLLKEDALPGGLAIHLDTYAVPDQPSAVLLFRQFDDRKSSRTKEDISGAYQCFHDAIRSCKRSAAKIAVEGIAWYRRDIQGFGVPSGDELYGLFDEERLHPFVVLVDSILDSKCNELRRVPVIAAMYGTWLDDAKRAAEFWRLTALGAKRDTMDAAVDLDEELTRLKEEKEKIKAGELYEKCRKAWIAHGDGDRVTNFKVNIKKGLQPIAA